VKTVAKKLVWLSGKRVILTMIAVVAAIVSARCGRPIGFFDGG